MGSRGETQAKCSDEDFIRLLKTVGPSQTSKHIGISNRRVYQRRRRLEKIYGPIVVAGKQPIKEYPHRQVFDVANGCIIVASDLHIWPDYESVALRALKKLCRELEPVAVILNGDVMDFPQISGHAPIGWESLPTVKEELENSQDHLADIERALKRGCRKIWNLGNHDARFETRLASVADQYKGIKGIHLSDHFPTWDKSWSAFVNNSVAIKHRFRGGIHATWNNTLYAGMTIVTGHLHSQRITPFTDYNGTRYGVDTGCVADIDQKTFVNYTEDNPLNWRSGFCVFSFRDHQLMHPELVTKWDDNHVQFRGLLIKA